MAGLTEKKEEAGSSVLMIARFYCRAPRLRPTTVLASEGLEKHILFYIHIPL